MVSNVVDRWAKMRTEENGLDLVGLAKAEARSQAVVEWGEEEKTEVVSADDAMLGRRATEVS